MLDLIVRNANLPDGRKGLDVAVKDGRIAEVAPAITAEAGFVPWADSGMRQTFRWASPRPW